MRRLRALTALVALVLTSSAGYTVKAGDTMSSIASRLKVDLSGLVKANKAKVANANRIFPGQVLDVPGQIAATDGAKGATVARPAQAPLSTAVVVISPIAVTHVVRPGENLSTIATQLRTTVAVLATANGLSTTRPLRVGQTLSLPAPPYLCPVQGARSYIDSWGFARSGGLKHEGNDIMAARGTPVVAPVGGVLDLRNGSKGGNAFYLHGNDGNTYYGAHLDGFSVGAGPVLRGQQVGIVGDTGDARGGATHLHFEIHPAGGGPVDPFFTLKAWGC